MRPTYSCGCGSLWGETAATILEQAGVGGLLNRDQGWSEKLVRGSSLYSIRLRITCGSGSAP
ncbi:MAG: hypothetical protein ACFCVB_14085 [Nodosilinea sp.]